jgi:hypothetical protein
VQILHIAFSVKLTLRKDIADMLRDDRPLTPEQLRNLRQPQRFALHSHVDFYFAVNGLIDNHVIPLPI